MQKIILFLSSGLGVGYLPLSPGTFGSLAGLAFYYGVGGLALFHYIMVALTMTALAVWLANESSRFLQVHDSPIIVVDEIAGILITFIGHQGRAWPYLVAGFILFRLFDIWKPLWVGQIDRRAKGGLGIVMDDVVAGIMANLALWALVGIITYFRSSGW